MCWPVKLDPELLPHDALSPGVDFDQPGSSISGMVLLPVTALYAGVLSILFTYLALRVGLTRASNGVMHGDGGKQDMVRKARAQGNLAEYLPVFLILFGLLEYNRGLSSYFLHLIGLVFTVLRVGHAAQLSFPDSVPRTARDFGFLGTAGTLGLLAILNILSYLTA